MSKLTEQDFMYMKEELSHGRLSPGGMNIFLIGALIFSLITVGIGYFVVTADNTVIGWTNLSPFWQSVFKVQPMFIGLHILIILLSMMKNNIGQLILAIGMVLFSYKMVLDPFIMLSMFHINDGVYEDYAPIIIFIIGLGIVLHLFLVRKEFSDRKVEKQKKRPKQAKMSIYFVGFLFFLVSVTGYAVSNNLFGDFESLFFLTVVSVVYFAVLIGAVEFVMGLYCLIRFPSFRMNTPEQIHHSAKKKRHKRK